MACHSPELRIIYLVHDDLLQAETYFFTRAISWACLSVAGSCEFFKILGTLIHFCMAHLLQFRSLIIFHSLQHFLTTQNSNSITVEVLEKQIPKNMSQSGNGNRLIVSMQCQCLTPRMGTWNWIVKSNWIKMYLSRPMHNQSFSNLRNKATERKINFALKC